MYNRACDIDGCNVWKCGEPLLSTKQNSIRFWRIQTEAVVWEPAVEVSETGFEPCDWKRTICGGYSDVQLSIASVLLGLEIVSSNEGTDRQNVNWIEYRTKYWCQCKAKPPCDQSFPFWCFTYIDQILKLLKENFSNWVITYIPLNW